MKYLHLTIHICSCWCGLWSSLLQLNCVGGTLWFSRRGHWQYIYSIISHTVPWTIQLLCVQVFLLFFEGENSYRGRWRIRRTSVEFEEACKQSQDTRDTITLPAPPPHPHQQPQSTTLLPPLRLQQAATAHCSPNQPTSPTHIFQLFGIPYKTLPPADSKVLKMMSVHTDCQYAAVHRSGQ